MSNTMNLNILLLLVTWVAHSFRILPTKRQFSTVLLNIKDRENQSELHKELDELKSRMLLGVVDSLCEEVIRDVKPNSLLGWGVDEFAGSVPHTVAADLLSTNSSTHEVTSPYANVTYRLVLVPTDPNTQQTRSYSEDSFEIGHVTIPVDMGSRKKVNESKVPESNASAANSASSSTGSAALAISSAVRYCVPPILLQSFPHRISQMVIQFVHEHYNNLLDFYHFLVTGNHLPQ